MISVAHKHPQHQGIFKCYFVVTQEWNSTGSEGRGQTDTFEENWTNIVNDRNKWRKMLEAFAQ